ncbi:MAG: Gfo/Idh/MocA family oxidoreductase [Thermoguttaceae bacterium]|nr:Gfo/Idh/MocA family oxidoreductase [Thermoguttaceae bacterium]MDW8036412.1 Gfo/Idh/MocA family oxidoreductase [Thermoguttaceae bacterium]
MNRGWGLLVRVGKMRIGLLAVGVGAWYLVTVVNSRLLGAEENPVAPAGQEHLAKAEQKLLRAGMIGLTTSHVIAFTNLINDPKATGPLAQVEVVAGFPGGIQDNPASWDRRPKYTEELRKRGIRIYESIPEMLRDVDVVLLEEVDGRPHLEWARPVIEAGKPLFIDKPLAANLADCIEIFQLAKEKGVPCFSSSSLRFGWGLEEIREGRSRFGKVKKCIAWSPMSIEPHHPDLYWYGIHGVEILFTIMGPGCQTVTREGPEKVVGLWKDGRVGIFEARKGYGAYVEGDKESGEVGKYTGYQGLVEEICKFFLTGKPPVTMEETLEIYTFMSAADESKALGGKPVQMQEVYQKALQQVQARRKK